VSRARVHANAATFAVAGAVLTGAVTVLYWHLISGQGDQDQRRPQLVAISLLAAACLLLVSTAMRARVARLLLLSAGSATLVIWSILGAFSIGVLLMPAAGVSLIAAGQTSERVSAASAWRATTAGAAAALLFAFVVLRYS
jgi:hypothetical protein